jgi:hypothetical protein
VPRLRLVLASLSSSRHLPLRTVPLAFCKVSVGGAGFNDPHAEYHELASYWLLRPVRNIFKGQPRHLPHSSHTRSYDTFGKVVKCKNALLFEKKNGNLSQNANFLIS